MVGGPGVGGMQRLVELVDRLIKVVCWVLIGRYMYGELEVVSVDPAGTLMSASAGYCGIMLY